MSIHIIPVENTLTKGENRVLTQPLCTEST